MIITAQKMNILNCILYFSFLANVHLSMADYRQNCYEVRNEVYGYGMECSVTSVSSNNPTLISLPEDVPALTFICQSKSRNSSLSANTFGRFTALKSLAIEQCNIALVTSSSFRGLPGLAELIIANSFLPELDTDTFEHIHSLELLFVVETNLKRLPDISHMSSLKYLNISFNNLSEIPFPDLGSNSSEYFPSLTDIDLSFNNFTTLPPGLFKGAPNIERLHIKGLSALQELVLPPEVKLNNLLLLYADQTYLKHLDLSGLSTASHLKELRLCGSGMPNDFSEFSGLTSLAELSLKEFGITDSIWSELNSTNLSRLDLTKNSLTSIDVQHMPSLQTLRVGENKISELREGAFIGPTGLLLLNASFNNISVLPKNLFRRNPNLQILLLSNNKLKHLDRSTFSDIQQLLILDLSFNDIQLTDNYVFADLTNMIYLHLQGNQLQTLPSVIKMPHLQRLNVSFNLISQILGGEMDGLDSLEIFDAADNRLTFIVPHMVTMCPNLLWLNLQNNQIRDVGTFGAHPKLQMLRLDNNSITDFESGSPFVKMLDLKHIFLDTNKLRTIRPFWFPVSITAITIGKNEICEFFTISFRNLPNLTFVDVEDNKCDLYMQSISVNTFKANTPKPKFWVSRNTFVCNCDMAYLKVIIEDGYANYVFSTYYPRFLGIETTLCLTPYENFTVRPMMDVPLSHFACLYDEPILCDLGCSCCDNGTLCQCALTCPEQCACYKAGSEFKRTYVHIHCNERNLQTVPRPIPSRATSVYLDGNSFGNLNRSELSHLTAVEIMFLNRSEINSLEDGVFDNMTSLLVLRLESNYLTSISKSLFAKQIKLKQLYLHVNRIRFIHKDAFMKLTSVELITLHNNRLTALQTVYGISSLNSLTLSGNPWQCQCNTSTDILRVTHALNDIIEDRGSMCCYLAENAQNNIEYSTISADARVDITEFPEEKCYELMSFPYEDLCIPRADNATEGYSTQAAESLILLICLIVAMFILLIIATTVLVLIFKGRVVQAWVYVYLGFRLYDKKVVLDKADTGKKYFDAFVSYSSKDSEFVSTVLVPVLDEKRYRVCVHYRDFPVGQTITDTIFRAIEESSRTLLILSKNFLESEWCRFEFQTAHHHILREGSHRLVIILVDDLSDDILDPDLKVHLKSKTYLKYSDHWFWEKLFFALPDVRETKKGDHEEDILKGMSILAGKTTVTATDETAKIETKTPSDVITE